MITCPDCQTSLSRAKGPLGIFWLCPVCGGRSATIPQLRKSVPSRVVNQFWQLARNKDYPKKRSCPACRQAMEEVPMPSQSGVQALDVCLCCHFVWLDAGELEALPVKKSGPAIGERPWPETLSMEAREKVAMAQLQAVRARRTESSWESGAPDHWWEYILAFLGMPVEHESSQVSHVPWVTWLIIGIVTLFSVMAFSDIEDAVMTFGLIPAKALRYGGLTFITSFFLHGNIMHLIGNMYFLLVFGDNVEDQLGKARYLLLLCLASLVGDLAHILGNSSSLMPCIGASGGISGIIAYYALKFPHAKLGILVFFRWVRMPAVVLFLIWAALQGYGVYAQLHGFSNVSALAHLGGAAMGFVFWLTDNDK